MFRFAQPEMLYLLLALPLLPAWWAWSARRARIRLHRLVGARLAPALTADLSPGRVRLGQALLLAAVACFAVGLARPQVGLAARVEAVRGLDILVVLDTSRSMAAADVAPSRLARAQRALRHLLERLEGNRFALIQYAGVAFPLCPFTQDTSVVKLLLDNLDTTALPVPGSDLGGAVQAGLQMLARTEGTGARHRVMLVVGDGENFGTRPIPAVKRAAEGGVRTYSLGVGTLEGAPIPQPARDGVDAAPPGRRTVLQEKNLSLLALFGGGTYARLSAGGEELDHLAEELQGLEKVLTYSRRELRWQERYPLPAAAAFLCLLLEWLLGRRRRGSQATAALLAVAFVGCIGAGPAGAATTEGWLRQGAARFESQDLASAEQAFAAAVAAAPDDPRAAYGLGCVYLAQQRYTEAQQAFHRTLPRARRILLRNAWYNLGCAAFYRGLGKGEAENWFEAAKAFQEVLVLDSGDEEARYNLELVLRLIQRHTRQNARRQTQTQGQDQGRSPGGGAERPGDDRTLSPGKDREDAPPREAQDTGTSRTKEGDRTSTSEEQPGRRQRGVSQEDALRTLRSLEADERKLQERREKSDAIPETYQGPYW